MSSPSALRFVDKYYFRSRENGAAPPGPPNKRKASNQDEELSEYEKKVQQNIAERQALFNQLDIAQLKATLKPPKRVHKKKIFEERREPSLRLQHRSPGGAPVKTLPTTEQKPSSIQLECPVAPIQKAIGPLRMKSVLSGLYGEPNVKAADRFLDEISSLEAYERNEDFSSNNSSLERFTSWISSATINLNNVCKVVHGKISSVVMHPSEEKIIICAGAAHGELGIIDMSTDEEDKLQLLLSPHSMAINKMAFCPQNPDKLYTSSSDGTVLCGDFHSKIFKKIFATGDVLQSYAPTLFDFVDSSIICITHGKASLSVFDERHKGITNSTDNLHSQNVRSVSIHPLQNNYVMTTGNDKKLNVWDLRYLKKKSLAVTSLDWQNSLYSASFSPLTGNTVLVTDALHIGILDSSACEKTLKCAFKIQHDNSGGRWMNNFLAVWHPQREDVFAVGSWKFPRQIEMMSTDGTLLHAFENLSSICSVCQFHPSLPVLAAANSSGKLFVYK